MKKLLCVVVMGSLVLMAGEAMAQCGVAVSGQVVNTLGNPLADVNVTVAGNGLVNIVNDITDAAGNYDVAWGGTPPLVAVITYAKAGYQPATKTYLLCSDSLVAPAVMLYGVGEAVPLTSKPVTWLIPVLFVGLGFIIYRRRCKREEL